MHSISATYNQVAAMQGLGMGYLSGWNVGSAMVEGCHVLTKQV
jgi:hypothetical protein